MPDLARREGDALSQIVGTGDTRFWRKVDQGSPAECWEWLDSLNMGGYGQYRIGPRKYAAHRVAYWLCIGPIADDQVIDHLCRNRACVNPFHLEAVSERENIMRGKGLAARNAKATHCINGHPFSDSNTYLALSGRRVCRSCQRQAVYRYRLRATGRPRGPLNA